MKKIDVKIEGMKIPATEYEVYAKLGGDNLIKLNLTVCQEVKIDIRVPVKLEDDIEKLNSSSDYYNDICNLETTEYGTDIILSDRRKEFIDNNKTVCQDGCIFSSYDQINQKATCSCEAKESSSSFADINIDIKRLYNNFVNFKNFANVALLSCVDVLFSEKGLTKNIGSYIILIIILSRAILILIFYLKNYFNKIKVKIEDITLAIKNWKLVRKYKREEKEKNTEKNNKEINLDDINNINNEKQDKKKKQNPPKIKLTYLNNINSNIIEGGIKNISKNSNSNLILNNNLNKTYELAIKNDNRSYSQYYFSLILTKHILISTFCNDNDYNIKIIKIDLFIFNFVLYFTINALFFNDNTMHKIYEDKGSFNFIYQLPQILYSSIISGLIGFILKKLALSQDDILEYKSIKRQKKSKNIKIEELMEKEKDLYKKLKIKFGLYFIISNIILLFFWYYLAMFCAIYQNTQIHLIKDTLISYGLGFIYPFGIYLIPGMFRIPSLADKKNKRECLYNISKLLQII